MTLTFPKRLLSLVAIIILSLPVVGQDKELLTLEEIFLSGTFRQQQIRGINWMKDGRYYTSQNGSESGENIDKYDITTGESVQTLVKGNTLENKGEPLRYGEYDLSADERKVLLASNIESIYRRSTIADYFVYDLEKGSLEKLDNEGRQSYATFSPDGSMVAYVRDNNLYVKDLASGKTTAITTTGERNKIIHGAADWVYEEEFSMSKAFAWSPDGSKIAYWTFDESAVREYNMQVWGGLYPSDYLLKYPKAGEDNSVVSISIFDTKAGESVKVDAGKETDMYIPRIYWAPDSKILSVIRMNRLQNQLDILHADASSGKTETVLSEESETYVDLNFIDDLTYLSDNKHFLRTSEKDGYKHIYLHKMDGSLVRQITKGEWVVDKFIGVDEKRALVYYISTENSPLQRHLYSIKLNGKGKKQLSKGDGTVSVNFSPDFQYYIQTKESVREPIKESLHRAPSGKEIKVLEDNETLRHTIDRFQFGQHEFTEFEAADGTPLNAYVIKPHDFDESKKYPVFMYVYGGPGSQTVVDTYFGSRELWLNYLATQGYIVVSVDNRGTGARGREFKHITYKQLGKYESEDQIAVAKQLAELPYVASDRIGIFGWSYGGYMSSLCLFTGSDVFSTAIAVAPVSNWRFYDTIYTERYLQRPQDNPSGYDDFSPLSHTEKLEGNYLLIHGTGDDNVHFQNAVALQDQLIYNSKQFESFYYPNRDHSIYGGNTRYHLFRMMTEFLKKNL
ncbi:S9 family peptidase [Roseivirga sp. BDSF3-8]|uniref:S9 family peptidase n=1 Tax=Roseivirga sp. BDSF3-8 TaxID=3241598 RepID=UPI0035322DAC